MSGDRRVRLVDVIHRSLFGHRVAAPQPKIFWLFLAVAIVATGVIVVESRAPDAAEVALPETPGTSAFSAVSDDRSDPPTEIPGCATVLAPDNSAVAFVVDEGSYDDPRYPWLSGRKATALSDALASALPNDTTIEFAAPGSALFLTESALRFGPVQGPSRSSSVDDPSFFASSNAAGLLIRNGRGVDLNVSLSQSKRGVPPCIGGNLDRRQVLADGTVVDTKESTGDVAGRTAVIRTVSAYAPDGTTLSVNASQFVSSDEVMSMEDLVTVVSSSDLRIDAPIPPGTRPAPRPCSGTGTAQDGPAVTWSDADRIGRALEHARIRALRAVIAFEQPLTPLQRGSFTDDTLCTSGTIMTPGSEGVLSGSITGGQPLPEIPDRYDPAADRSVDVVRLPDGSISERSKRGARTVTVTRPSGTRVRISSTSAGDLITIGNLESIATAPGLDL